MSAKIRIRAKFSSNDNSKSIPLPIEKLSHKKDYEKFNQNKDNSINKFTVDYNLMPDWIGSNEYIYGGYRRITNSLRGCLLSLGYLHNETGNVYTHLIGFISVLPVTYIFCFDYMLAVSTVRWSDFVVQLAFVVGLLACLAGSTTFHLCCCHSRHVFGICSKMDYIGIVFLQVGSFMPILYYGFYCNPYYQAFYMTTIVSLGMLTLNLTINPKFAVADYRYLRTLTFSALGLMGVFPLIHSILKFGMAMSMHSISAGNVIAMGIIYLVGAAIYAFRIPERWIPGCVDIFGHSHQIWHLLVVAAAYTHYAGSMKAFHWWHEKNPTCAISEEAMIDWFQS